MISPYKRPPQVPVMAILLPDRTVLDERGKRIDLDNFPLPAETGETVRVFCSYDTVRKLVLEGYGEALCWNREEIRWRHRQFEQGWRNRPSDVSVLKTPFPDDVSKALRALCNWRDWLASYRAVPVGTTGSAAWSLLRACLRKDLWLGVGSPPPLRQTLGGRQELGPAGAGTFTGSIEQLDIPAAYAWELGHLPYGGRWFKASEFVGGNRPPEWWAQQGRPTFCRAVVRVPDSFYLGPLPRRPRGRRSGLRALVAGASYPVGVKLQGLWTWQELLAAEAAGSKIVRVLETWGHISGDETPFLPWWNAIHAGRQMPGMAGQLAKMTGNALWGRFCMDNSVGERSVSSHKPGERHMRTRVLNFIGGSRPDHALAETVSGRIRAALFMFMYRAGDRLISAHTDGAWTYSLGADAPEGWRRKQRAVQLDLLDSQHLRYFTSSREPVAVFSGVPASLSLEHFQKAWEGAGYAA